MVTRVTGTHAVRVMVVERAVLLLPPSLASQTLNKKNIDAAAAKSEKQLRLVHGALVCRLRNVYPNVYFPGQRNLTTD